MLRALSELEVILQLSSRPVVQIPSVFSVFRIPKIRCFQIGPSIPALHLFLALAGSAGARPRVNELDDVSVRESRASSASIIPFTDSSRPLLVLELTNCAASAIFFLETSLRTCAHINRHAGLLQQELTVSESK